MSEKNKIWRFLDSLDIKKNLFNRDCKKKKKQRRNNKKAKKKVYI